MVGGSSPSLYKKAVLSVASASVPASRLLPYLVSVLASSLCDCGRDVKLSKPVLSQVAFGRGLYHSNGKQN